MNETKENQGVVEYNPRESQAGFIEMKGRGKPSEKEMMAATRSDRKPKVEPAPHVENID